MHRNDNAIPVEELTAVAVYLHSRHVDWLALELGKDFEFADPAECEGCGSVVVMHGGESTHREEDPDTDCGGYLFSEGPMMNTFYPLPDRGEYLGTLDDVAEKLAGLPLCAVEMADGEIGMALTGGGMDLTWEIVAGYMALGYLPPFQFTSLPGYDGYPEKYPHIVAACKRSCEILASWATHRAEELSQMK